MYRGQAAGCQGRRKGLLGITPHLATGSRHLALLLEGRAGWSLEAALAAPPPSVAGWAAERHWVLGRPWSRAPPFSGWVGVWCGAGSAGLGFLPGRRDLGGWRRRQAPPARGMATLGVVMFPGEVPRPGPPWDLGWADGRGRQALWGAEGACNLLGSHRDGESLGSRVRSPTPPPTPTFCPFGPLGKRTGPGGGGWRGEAGSLGPLGGAGVLGRGRAASLGPLSLVLCQGRWRRSGPEAPSPNAVSSPPHVALCGRF